jgi:hypothetical protein
MINKHQRKVKQTLTLKDIYLYLQLQNNIQKLEQLEIFTTKTLQEPTLF